MLEKEVWAVVGSHGRNPIADDLVKKLQRNGKTVHAINPHPNADGPDALGSLDPMPDVVNLVVSPSRGPGVLQSMIDLGIKNLWVQPGAAFEEIEEKCEENQVLLHFGCVLIEAPEPGE